MGSNNCVKSRREMFAVRFYRRGNMLREGEELPKIPELESSGAGIPIPGLQPAVLQTRSLISTLRDHTTVQVGG